MGAAATGIGVATYLMASGEDTASWIVYGVAAVITVAMPVASWFYLRQLHGVLEPSELSRSRSRTRDGSHGPGCMRAGHG